MDTTVVVTGTGAITVLIPVIIPGIITGAGITETPVIIMAVTIITAAILVEGLPISQALPRLGTPTSPAPVIKRAVEEVENILTVAGMTVTPSTETKR